MSIRQIPGLLLLAVCFGLFLGQAEAGTYTDNKDGTITDTETSLMWQKSDDGVERTWNDAVAYCEELKLAGYEDWVLPEIQMLQKLVDNTFSPTIDPMFSVRLSYYWSQTEGRESVNAAKYINFFYGNTYSFIKDNTYYSICARDISESTAEAMGVKVESVLVSDNIPYTVQFSSTISGGSEPYFFEWDFNDGEFSSLSKPGHTYKKSGDYHVVVTVTDNDGAIAVGREVLTITEPRDIGQKSSLVNSVESVVLPVAIDNAAALDDNNSKVLEPAAVKDLVEIVVAATPAAMASLKEKPTDQKDNSLNEVDDTAQIDDNGTVEGVVHDFRKDSGTLIVDDAGVPVVTDAVVAEPEEVGDKDENTTAVSQGSLKIFASSAFSSSRTTGVKEGLLAYSFSNGLRGDADWNKDEKVTARELKGYLGTAIDNLSQGKQEAVMNMSANDFQVCADAGVTIVLAVGVNTVSADGLEGLSFAAQNAQAIAQIIAEKCPSWKQLVLTGKETARNNVIRALLKMKNTAGPHDNFIFYYAGPSEGSEQGLNLFTYDTLAELPGMTGIAYDDLAGLLDESEAANIMLLFEVGSHVRD